LDLGFLTFFSGFCDFSFTFCFSKPTAWTVLPLPLSLWHVGPTSGLLSTSQQCHLAGGARNVLARTTARRGQAPGAQSNRSSGGARGRGDTVWRRGQGRQRR
jgi:hypothetical protein